MLFVKPPTAFPTEELLKNKELVGVAANEVVLFHILDAQEIDPKFRDPVLLMDVEDNTAMEVSPDYARNEYREKFGEHLRALKDKAASAGLDYVLMDTSKPLDEGLRTYLSMRQRRR